MNQLTVLKKPANFCESVRWKLLDVFEVSVLGIISTDGDDLVIFFTLINHGHEANGPSTKEASWKNRFLHDDKDIDWILILTERAGDETIVVGIHNR